MDHIPTLVNFKKHTCGINHNLCETSDRNYGFSIAKFRQLRITLSLVFFGQFNCISNL